jgi:C4-dicarboxylate-specific signal transduction histidine kinase
MIGTYGRGPTGTGLFLLGANARTAEVQEAEPWLLLLFIPVAPLARWRVRVTLNDAQERAGESLEIQVLERLPLQPLAAARRLAIGIAWALVACLPLAFAVSRVGNPWAATVLSALLGSLLPASLLDKAATAAEAGLLVAGALVPILVATELDAHTLRVPLAALRPGSISPGRDG